MSYGELLSEMGALSRGEFAHLSDENISEKVREIHKQFAVKIVVWPKNTVVYRARRVSTLPAHKDEISYPPEQFIKQRGRCNRIHQSMFYASIKHFATCLEECSSRPNEFFVVSIWRMNESMHFNHMGYSKRTYAEFNCTREPIGLEEKLNDSVRNRTIRDWQAKIFTQKVPRGQEEKYRLTNIFTDFALAPIRDAGSLSAQQFAGLMYPSIAMKCMGDNMAIRPQEVDRKLTLLDAMLVTELPNSDNQLQRYDCANVLPDGALRWGCPGKIFTPDFKELITYDENG